MKKRGHIQKLMERAGHADEAGVNGSSEEFTRQVAAMAYEIYQQRGREDGYDMEDWLKAEAIMKSRPVP